MIVWIANTPTPQFAPVLDNLHSKGVPIKAYYSSLGDAGRGWGALGFSHPAIGASGSTLRMLFWGMRLALSSTTEQLVVLGYAKPLALGALLGARVCRKRVFTLSDSTIAHEKRLPPVKGWVKRRALRLLYGPTARAWTISEENEDYWRRYGVTVALRVPFESPVPESSSVALEEHEGPVVLTVCRVVEEKGVLELAEAVDALRPSRPGLIGVAIGPYDDAIAQQVSNRLLLVGGLPRTELGAWYERADVVVLASWQENYGLVVREALQFGVPVVGTRAVPAIRTLCDRGWNVVEPQDSAGLLRAIDRALDEGGWPRSPWIDISPLLEEQFALHSMISSSSSNFES